MIKKIFWILTTIIIFSLSHSNQAHSKATLTSSAGATSIDIKIKVIGPGGSTELASTIQSAIEENWDQGSEDYSCHDIDFDVTVEFADGYDELTIKNNPDKTLADNILSSIINFPTFDGYEVWYVPDIAPGTVFRPGAAVGDFSTDLMGTVSPYEHPKVYAHETGHVMTLDDQYECTYDDQGKATCVATSEEYENSIMNDAIPGIIDALTFEDLLSGYESATGNDINACLSIYLHIDNGSLTAPSANLTYYATMNFDVVPENALTTVDSSNELTGSGTGSSEWITVITNPDTLFAGFESTVDPYDMTISGDMLSSIYTINFQTTDLSEASMVGSGVYMSWSDCEAYFPYSTGSCTGLSSTLDELMIDTSKVKTGTTCTFNTSAGDFTGTYYLEITSIQG